MMFSHARKSLINADKIYSAETKHADFMYQAEIVRVRAQLTNSCDISTAAGYLREV